MIRGAAGLAFVAGFIGCSSTTPEGPYLATGIKIGEVTTTSALVWARLTRSPQRVASDTDYPDIRYIHPESGELVPPPPWPATPADWVPVVEYPQALTVDDLEGAVPGAPGEVRVLYRGANETEWRTTDWAPVESARDYTVQIPLGDLLSDSEYALRVEARPEGSNTVSAAIDGQLRTAPDADEPARVVFGSVTGQDYINRDSPDGYKIYPAMLERDLDFFVHTGDVLYYDSWAKDMDLARWGWSQMYSLPTNYEFQRQIPTYFMKDDHDVWLNDAWPSQTSSFMGDFTFAQGQQIFLEQVPITGDTPYRTFRWGQDLQIWLTEARDYRDPNTDPDGPDKTMWGEEQKRWFMETVETSDATFRIAINPTPMTGPYTDPIEMDNHTNMAGFAYEGRELREFIARQNNMVVIAGDRHFQYVIEDPETGILEFATGPASNEHARGWSNDDVRPEHRYINVVGGFLLTTVTRQNGVPILLMQHFSVDGELLHEERLTAQ
jgi:alkaline phosphatase D